MESEEAAFEEAVFEQILETRHLDQAFNHTPNGNESALLNASGEVVGPAKSLEVAAGDTVKMEVFAKYTEPSSNTYEGAITGMAGEIAGAFGNPVVTEGGQYLSEVVDVALAGGAAFSSGDNNVPRAYLQYLLFDKDYVLHQSGFVQISSSANGTGAPFDHLVLDVPIDKSGFIYIYTANETDDPAVNAYFDDLKITHKQMVVQADDYYPFGLSIEALSYQRLGDKGNDFLYNNKELERSLDLNWYDYGARMYMSDLGRFPTIDRFAEKYYALTPYQYAASNPILFVDVNGDSLQVSGNQEATQQFLDIINQGLGGFFSASVDENGLVTLESTDQEGNLTNEQQTFFDVISEATSLETGLSTFNLVNESDAISEDVLFGDNGDSEISATPGQHTIDVGDAQALGSDGKLTSQGVVAHEVKEGFEIQVQGTNSRIAHGRGIAAESRTTGTIIVSPGASPNANRTRITVPVQRGNERSTVTITFRNGNVKRVRGNKR